MAWFIAQQSKFDSIVWWQTTKWTPESDINWLLAAVGAVLLATALKAIWRRRRQASAPGRLFASVAAHIGLTRDDRRLLEAVARSAGLSSPISLLLSAGTLNHHSQRYLSQISPSQEAKVRARVGAIRVRLFEDETDTEPTKQPPTAGA